MAVTLGVFSALGQCKTRPQKFALADFRLQVLGGHAITILARHRLERSNGSTYPNWL